MHRGIALLVPPPLYLITLLGRNESKEAGIFLFFFAEEYTDGTLSYFPLDCWYLCWLLLIIITESITKILPNRELGFTWFRNKWIHYSYEIITLVNMIFPSLLKFSSFLLNVSFFANFFLLFLIWFFASEIHDSVCICRFYELPNWVSLFVDDFCSVYEIYRPEGNISRLEYKNNMLRLMFSLWVLFFSSYGIFTAGPLTNFAFHSGERERRFHLTADKRISGQFGFRSRRNKFVWPGKMKSSALFSPNEQPDENFPDGTVTTYFILFDINTRGLICYSKPYILISSSKRGYIWTMNWSFSTTTWPPSEL